MAKCTFGTGAFLLANTGATRVRSGGRADLLGRLAGRGADTLLRRRAGLHRGLRGPLAPASLGVITGADDLDAVAAADSDGVLCVPALAGLAAPWWQSGRHRDAFRHDAGPPGAGTWSWPCCRASPPRSPSWRRPSVADDLGAPLTRLRVDGGLTRSRPCSCRPSPTSPQIPIDVYPSAHATALGAAALARLQP